MDPSHYLFRDSRYEIRACLGDGGFGVVYRAHDRERGVDVALKLLNSVDPEALYLFKREFRLMADINHPNLVSLYELSTIREKWFLTMELIDGVNFNKFVRVKRPAPSIPGPDEKTLPLDAWPTDGGGANKGNDGGAAPAIRLPLGCDLRRLHTGLEQLSVGLMALHEMGILHRDVKPSNVLVTADERLVLLDFGLVTELTPEQSARTMNIAGGTAAYLAPETMETSSPTAAADWYSVGVMLYEALTGRLPFAGSTAKVLHDKFHTDPAPPASLVDGVPPALGELCTGLLSRDPSVRASGQSVLSVLGHPRVPPVAPTSSSDSIELIWGREKELEQLREAYEESRRGKTVVVQVFGGSGVGKSALVRSFASSVRKEGALVLSGRCYAQESVPHKALDSLIDSLYRRLNSLDPKQRAVLLPDGLWALARLFPVLRSLLTDEERRADAGALDPQEVSSRALAALRELLSRMARRGPVVLFLDDLQWGDLDSAILLREVLRAPSPPMLVAAVFRAQDAETNVFLRHFCADQAASSAAEVCKIALEPLSQHACRDMALAQLEGEQVEALAQAIARESAGNPFLVEQLVQYGSSLRVQGLGISLEDLVWNRVQGLSADERRLLEIISVAGAPILQRIAHRASGLRSNEQRATRALRAAKLIRSVESQGQLLLEIYHDRVRETVMARLAADRRVECHRLLAGELLQCESPDVDRLMTHFREAGDLEQATRYALAAADRAFQALAFDRAVALYLEVLKAHPGVDEQARRLRSSLAHALACAGRGREAAEHYLEAANGAPPADAFNLRRCAAEQLLQHGHIDAGTEVLRKILPEIGLQLPRTPKRALLSLLANRAYLRMRGLNFRKRDESELPPEQLARIDVCWSIGTGMAMNDTILAADLQTRNLRLSLKAGEPYRIARAVALQAAFSATGGPKTAGRTRELLKSAWSLANELEHPHARGMASLGEGTSGYLEGRFAHGAEWCGKAEVFLREWPGTTWEVTTVQIYEMTCEVYLGRLRRLARLLSRRLGEAERRGNLYAQAAMRLSPISIIWLANDEPELLAGQIDEAVRAWSKKGFHIEHYWEMLARGQLDLYLGRADRALDWLAERWPAFAHSLLPRIQLVKVQAYQLRGRCYLAAARGESRARFLKAAESDEEQLRKEKVPWSQALAALLAAGVAFRRGDSRAAVNHLRAAVEQLDAAEMALYAAAARFQLARLLSGDEGARIMQPAERWMLRERVRNPQRLVDMLVPGFEQVE